MRSQSQSLQIIHISNGYFPRKWPKITRWDTSEIPVRPSVKNFKCYVLECYLKKISVVGVYRAAIPSEKFSWECLPPIEVSNLLCYLVFTQISSLRPWKVGICTARWFLVSLRQWERNGRQNCCSQGERFAVNEWFSFGSLQKVSVATIQ